MTMTAVRSKNRKRKKGDVLPAGSTPPFPAHTNALPEGDPREATHVLPPGGQGKQLNSQCVRSSSPRSVFREDNRPLLLLKGNMPFLSVGSLGKRDRSEGCVKARGTHHSLQLRGVGPNFLWQLGVTNCLVNLTDANAVPTHSIQWVRAGLGRVLLCSLLGRRADVDTRRVLS